METKRRRGKQPLVIPEDELRQLAAQSQKVSKRQLAKDSGYNRESLRRQLNAFLKTYPRSMAC
jgi:hypothetical protein